MARYWKEKSQALFDQAVKAATEMLVPEEVEKTKRYLAEIQKELGPVIEAYPSWHPLVRHIAQSTSKEPALFFQYPGVDHPLLFANGFLSAPYSEEKIQETIDAIESLPLMDDATITYERINLPLYHQDAKLLLVRVHWNRSLLSDGTLPLYIVVPNVLKMVMASAFSSSVGEDWRSMSLYFIGSPRSEDESVFVNAETTAVLKRLWNDLRDMGCFGQKREYVPGEKAFLDPKSDEWPWRTVSF